MTKRGTSIAVLAIVATLTVPLAAQQQQQRAAAIPSIDDRTAGMKKLDGYFPLYWDERAGTLYLEIARFDSDFLFSNGLSAGLGSNDIGLDRGRGGQGRVVQFQRVGPRVFLIQNNQSFRSSAKNPLERKSVEDSFAKSILWGFEVQGESGGRVLVNATDFFLRDVNGAANSLRPGNYRIDRTRSAFYMPNTRNFPQNTEVDVTLTFVNEPTGGGGGGGGGPAQGPQMISPAPRLAAAVAVAAVVCSRAASAASRRVLIRSPCASTSPSCSCRMRATSPASTIRAPATAASAISTTARRSPRPSSSASFAVIACRRRIRAPR